MKTVRLSRGFLPLVAVLAVNGSACSYITTNVTAVTASALAPGVPQPVLFAVEVSASSVATGEPRLKASEDNSVTPSEARCDHSEYVCISDGIPETEDRGDHRAESLDRQETATPSYLPGRLPSGSSVREPHENVAPNAPTPQEDSVYVCSPTSIICEAPPAPDIPASLRKLWR